MNRLDGKVVLITGAARGSGAVTARLLAENGAHVVLADGAMTRVRKPRKRSVAPRDTYTSM